jgi:hypothetical protein
LAVAARACDARAVKLVPVVLVLVLAACGGGADQVACDENEVSGEDGHHNPGLDCLGCHGATPVVGAPTWTVAGTVFTDISGSEPVAGAAVHLRDADGDDVVLRTAANGNFWTDQAIAFPISPSVSSCPDTAAMGAEVVLEEASCQRSGCHDSLRRIHLP